MARLDRHARAALRQLARAAARGRPVRIRFQDTERSLASRTVDVLALAFDDGGWRVATWTPELASLRLLTLDRIRHVRGARRASAPPPDGFDAAWFALRPLLGGPGDASATTSLRLGPGDARLAAALLPAGRAVPCPSGGTVYHVHSCRPARVRALAATLGWGDALDCSPLRSVPRGGTVANAETRILKLVAWILAEAGPVTAEQIFEAFPDDYGPRPTPGRERKFTRDKAAIRRLGYALGTVDDEQHYAIDPSSSRLPTVRLSPEEALAVWTAGAAALRFSDHPLRDELEHALRKLVAGQKGLPPRAAPDEPAGDGDDGPERRLLLKLADAWSRRRRVVIDYWHPGRDEVTAREVDVFGWARRRGEWLFAGHCHRRDAVRVFYLSRVRKLALAPARGGKRAAEEDEAGDYVIPPGFDIRRWSRQEIWDYEVHEPKGATIRFSGSLAGIARQLVRRGKVTPDAQGRRTVHLEVRNLRGLVRQALAWGPEAELLEPAEGRALARELLAEIRALGKGGAA